MLQRIVCVIALLLMIPDAAMSEETISGTYVKQELARFIQDRALPTVKSDRLAKMQ